MLRFSVYVRSVMCLQLSASLSISVIVFVSKCVLLCLYPPCYVFTSVCSSVCIYSVCSAGSCWLLLNQWTQLKHRNRGRNKKEYNEGAGKEAEAEAGAGEVGLQEFNTCSNGSNPEKKSVFWTCSSIQPSLAKFTNQSEENIQ